MGTNREPEMEVMSLQEYLRKNLRHLVLAASTLSVIQKNTDQNAVDGMMAMISLMLAEETIRSLLVSNGITEEEVHAVIDSANSEIDMIRKISMN